jgi:hypothetical protein
VRKFVLIPVCLLFVAASFGQALDSVKIKELLHGGWVDTINNTHFVYWDINQFAITIAYIINEPTEEPAPRHDESYSISKIKCQVDSLNENVELVGTGYYLQLMSNYKYGRNDCYEITSITSDRLTLAYKWNGDLYYDVFKKMRH